MSEDVALAQGLLALALLIVLQFVITWSPRNALMAYVSVDLFPRTPAAGNTG